MPQVCSQVREHYSSSSSTIMASLFKFQCHNSLLNQLVQKNKEFQFPPCSGVPHACFQSIIFNPDLPIVLECDANPYQVGAYRVDLIVSWIGREAHCLCRQVVQSSRKEQQLNREGGTHHSLRCDQLSHKLYLYRRKLILSFTPTTSHYNPDIFS